MRDVKERVTYCSVCSNITDTDPCCYCTQRAARPATSSASSKSRRTSAAVEKTRDFKGVYHVLMGALSPLQGVGPDDLKIKGLLTRVGDGGVDEVILATNPTSKARRRRIYLARLLKPLGVRVTRIAMGVPVGSDLEYADEVTMHKAMEGRREVVTRSVMLPHVATSCPRAHRAACSAALVACFAGYRLFRIVLGDVRLHPRRAARELGVRRQRHRRRWWSRRSSAAWSAR